MDGIYNHIGGGQPLTMPVFQIWVQSTGLLDGDDGEDGGGASGAGSSADPGASRKAVARRVAQQDASPISPGAMNAFNDSIDRAVSAECWQTFLKKWGKY